ncbi:MAG TPA: hypothetical protein VMZ50_11390 [Phycisphaerae bacterium]|nr:hypothetical protein [Phycisphaerae bacterium]
MSMFWRLHQQRQIAEAASTASKGASKVGEVQRDLRGLEDRVAQLSLVCSAMWSLIQEQTDLTEEDLMERVKEMDLQDGVADGKATKKLGRCPHCGRPMSARKQRCLYCGKDRPKSSTFDSTV